MKNDLVLQTPSNYHQETLFGGVHRRSTDDAWFCDFLPPVSFMSGDYICACLKVSVAAAIFTRPRESLTKSKSLTFARVTCAPSVWLLAGLPCKVTQSAFLCHLAAAARSPDAHAHMTPRAKSRVAFCEFAPTIYCRAAVRFFQSMESSALYLWVANFRLGAICKLLCAHKSWSSCIDGEMGALSTFREQFPTFVPLCP